MACKVKELTFHWPKSKGRERAFRSLKGWKKRGREVGWPPSFFKSSTRLFHHMRGTSCPIVATCHQLLSGMPYIQLEALKGL